MLNSLIHVEKRAKRSAGNGRGIRGQRFRSRVQWQQLWNFDVLATPREFVVRVTELLVGEDKEQRQVLKILRSQKL